MIPYHKIQTIYKRNDKGKILVGEYSIPEIEYLKDNQWQWREKLDGTNIRIGHTPAYMAPDSVQNSFEIKGRTNKAIVPKHLLEGIQKLVLSIFLLRLTLF